MAAESESYLEGHVIAPEAVVGKGDCEIRAEPLHVVRISIHEILGQCHAQKHNNTEGEAISAQDQEE